MKVDTSFIKRRREQQVKFERSVLRELSIKELKKGLQEHFGAISSQGGTMLESAIEEGCFDVAVEAYLLGSRYSRVGYYGEDIDTIRNNTNEERENLSKALAEFISYWSNLGEVNNKDESLKYKCEQYIEYWWKEGFENGKMKFKMKMH